MLRRGSTVETPVHLAPSDAPWAETLWATGVCLWVAAIGAPLAQAVFGGRERRVWPFFAPVVGLAAVLLVTNLAAYVVPGAPAAWVGLALPSAGAAALVWRRDGVGRPARGAPHPSTDARTTRANLLDCAHPIYPHPSTGPRTFRWPRRGTLGWALGFALASGGAFVFLLAVRTQVWFVDETWHFPLALRMARGEFPPLTPYGPDAGIGYHYGADLLAASVVSVAPVPVWTAFYTLLAFLVLAMLLAAVGLARDVGAPLPLAVCAGAVVALYSRGFWVGVPQLVDPPQGRFDWLASPPHQPLAAAIAILIAAALQQKPGARPAALIAVAAGVSALAEASVMIFAGAALAVVGSARLTKLRGSDRGVLAAALTAGAALAVFAGGPVSDELLGRGGTTGMVRLEFDRAGVDLAPFDTMGVGLARVGILPLLAVGGAAAVLLRSWGVGFLTLAGAVGLLEALVLQTALPQNEARILWLATALAGLAALAGIGALISRLPGTAARPVAGLAASVLVMLPTALPQAVWAAQTASRGLELGPPSASDATNRYHNRSQLGAELAANGDFYAWLAQKLPVEARLLTPHPSAAASLAGVTSPTSGHGLQVLGPMVTPVYEDALRFLHRDDLSAMGITHLHVTERLADTWPPQVRRMLNDPRHFKMLADLRSTSGQRHRVFAVRRGAGTTYTAPSSYRALRAVVYPGAPIALAGGLSIYQRRMLLLTFAERDALFTVTPTIFERATRLPRHRALTTMPTDGVVILPESLEPGALGMSRDDALWRGYGVRAYDLSAPAWSPVWRVGQATAGLPERQRAVCEAAVRHDLELRVLGEPGGSITVDGNEVQLTGIPQHVRLAGSDCAASASAAHTDSAPFAQVRPSRAAPPSVQAIAAAGLGFDGGVAGDRVVVNLWYRNPQGLPFETGVELRLYAADALGIAPEDPGSHASIRWWRGPLALAPDAQIARLEFDPRRLEIDGKAGAGTASHLTPGAVYLLTLNVAGADQRSGSLDTQHVIPLARVRLDGDAVAAEVFAGIAAIEPRAPQSGPLDRNSGLDGWLGMVLDRTP